MRINPVIVALVIDGVVNDGLVENTRLDDKVPVVPEAIFVPVPPLARGRVFVTCDVKLTAPEVTWLPAVSCKG